MDEEGPRQRPGGRSAMVREAVLKATLEFLELGQTPTVEAVARRAGVQKTTLYRRWSTLEGMVFDAVQVRVHDAVPIPDTGSCQGDLKAYMAAALAFHCSPIGSMLTRLSPQVPETMRRAFWAPRLAAAAAMLERGKERGEVRADVDTRFAVEVLIAPFYLRALVTAEPLDNALAEQLCDVLIAAVGAR